MPLFKDEALVLRGYDLGESDLIVSLFGRRHGRTRIVAKGAKKLKSRFAGRLEPLNRIDVVFFGKEQAALYKLSGAEISKAQTAFSSNLDKFYRACYLLEMVEIGLREGDPNPQAFDTVVAGLDWFSVQTSAKDFEWMTRFFDVKFLSALGYRPTLERCVNCRKEWTGISGGPQFDPSSGGLLCPKCSKGKLELMSLSSGAARFLGKMLVADFEKAERLKPSPALMGEISGAIVAFRNARLGKAFKTERFLKTA